MAVLPMEKVHLVALKRDRKTLLELLQRRGVVEVEDIPVDEGVFRKKDTAATKQLLEKNAETARQAVSILRRYADIKAPSLAFLRGRKAVSVQQSADFYNRDETVLRHAQYILQKERDIAEANAEIARVAAMAEALAPWMNLPIPQTFTGTKKTAVFIGSLGGELTSQKILEKLAEAAPELDAVHVEIVRMSKEQTCFYAIVPKANASEMEEALRAIGFVRPAGPTHRLPAEKAKRLEERRANAQANIREAEEDIVALAGECDDLLYLEDHMEMRAEKYGTIQKLAQTRHVFILQGYVPKHEAPALQQTLTTGFECEVELYAPSEDEDVPVLLRNNWFAEPTESVLENYSMPGKTDIDPTNVMSFFYYLMFGLMFGDAGYGLIMVAVCGFCLLKFKNMEPNWNKNVRMFFWCGVFTVFWGVIFSSYFGDIVDVISETFFGHRVSIPPVWFNIVDKPVVMLVFCLGIGLVHLTVGYIMKGITNAHNKDYPGIIYDMVFPIVTWYPLVVLLMGSDLFANLAGFKLALPAIATPICLGITGAALIGIVFTGGRESKRWPIRLLKGVYAVYNTLSGWLSDMLSYARLMALGLASGIIASVMNQLGSMAGGSVVGVILFVVVFLLGQGMNFGINVLGTYVHSNRLEYIEFFGKFYEGGGRKFEPYGIHTKHYKIIDNATKL